MKLRYRRPRRPIPAASSISVAADIARDFLRRKGLLELQEAFLVMPLDTACNVLGLLELSRGTLNASLVDIRQLMAAVLLANARGFIVIHNHPSGNLTPSRADIQLTETIAKASKTLDLDFEDHLIVTREGYTSMKRQGLILNF